MAKLAVIVEGGVVQAVLSDSADCTVTVVDYDNEVASGEKDRQPFPVDVNASRVAELLRGDD